jgi:hypothetical protein
VAQLDPKERAPGTSTGAGGRTEDLDDLDDIEPLDGPDALEDFGDDQEDGDAGETVDELGRRHIRRAAPEGTEELLEKEAPRRSGLPDWAEGWRMKTATGAVFTAVAFGLQQAFEGDKKEPSIIMETSGDPPKDLPVEAQLEQLGPRRSSVTVRPWLLSRSSEAPGPNGDHDEMSGAGDAEAAGPTDLEPPGDAASEK